MTNPPYSTLPSEADDSDALTRLALDLSWSWSHLKVTAQGTFSIRTPATRDAVGFAARILPYHVLAPPPEVRRILWQR